MPRQYPIPRVNECGHPERKHMARGMCNPCYTAWRNARSPDLFKASARRYRIKNRGRLNEERRLRAKQEYSTAAGWLRIRAWHLKKTFGLTVADYEEMFQSQNGVCAICHQPEKVTRRGIIIFLAIDHNHDTGNIRGLLCQRCNHMIGHSNDSAERLREGAAYLDRY